MEKTRANRVRLNDILRLVEESGLHDFPNPNRVGCPREETLEAFAESALQHRAQRLMIDVREFKHRPSAEILAWRDDVTVGKYNLAGVKKLVWVWPGNIPSNMPASQKAKYENRYCSTEAEALAWIVA